MCCLTPAQWDTSSTDEQFVCVCSSKQGWCLWLPKQWPHGLANIFIELQTMAREDSYDFVQPAAALEVDLGASFLTREVDLLGSFLSSRG